MALDHAMQQVLPSSDFDKQPYLHTPPTMVIQNSESVQLLRERPANSLRRLVRNFQHDAPEYLHGPSLGCSGPDHLFHQGTLATGSGVLQSLKPSSDPSYNFSPSDYSHFRSQPGQHHTGDIMLRWRVSGLRPDQLDRFGLFGSSGVDSQKLSTARIDSAL
ncbi:hypothetical protein E4U58_004788 [Claviceps cyperi]|nr:hypothetical protein E4U58_004788 [Claviceps cyperi]